MRCPYQRVISEHWMTRLSGQSCPEKHAVARLYRRGGSIDLASLAFLRPTTTSCFGVPLRSRDGTNRGEALRPTSGSALGRVINTVEGTSTTLHRAVRKRDDAGKGPSEGGRAMLRT